RLPRLGPPRRVAAPAAVVAILGSRERPPFPPLPIGDTVTRSAKRGRTMAITGSRFLDVANGLQANQCSVGSHDRITSLDDLDPIYKRLLAGEPVAHDPPAEPREPVPRGPVTRAGRRVALP
ncbi:MAG TPA: hypothetical protein VLD61_04410, partial [Methylomirabilota bacterium]|nr:hypothetical protein [Methylomirabilota bacterium]